MAREPEAITELRRSLGAQLATFRLAAELTQGRLAKIVICDRTAIVHIEKGRARGDERFWRSADAACDAGGALLAAYLELETAKAEHEQQDRDRRLEDVRAKAAELRGRRSPVGDQTQDGGETQVGVPQLDELRRALLLHRSDDAQSDKTGPESVAQLGASVTQAHTLYQRADYDGAAQLLPLVINRIEASQVDVPVRMKAAAYLAAAKLATKMGDSGLAWVAADRSLRLASETGRQGLVGVAHYQVACALLGSGHLADAELAAQRAVEKLSGAGPARSAAHDIVAAHGALLLLLAITAARRKDAQLSKRYLRDASVLAERLGHDGNWLWTAFGPTNIAIHELAVQVALGDSRTALHLGSRIDVDALPPVLRGRRSQVHLELGWASVGQGDDSLAVLHLLEAERVAKQAVSRNIAARTLLTTLLARERHSATPGLRALATRAGVV